MIIRTAAVAAPERAGWLAICAQMRPVAAQEPTVNIRQGARRPPFNAHLRPPGTVGPGGGTHLDNAGS